MPRTDGPVVVGAGAPSADLVTTLAWKPGLTEATARMLAVHAINVAARSHIQVGGNPSLLVVRAGAEPLRPDRTDVAAWLARSDEMIDAFVVLR